MSVSPIRLAVNGACGRMGRAIVELLPGDPRFALQRAVVNPDSGEVGTPVASLDCGLHHVAGWADAGELDAVIDFSAPAGLAAALEHCQTHGVALVTGTTGMDAQLEERLRAASSRIPILRASNFSLGVAVLNRLVREAAAALPDWDLEILEAHHGRKQDAPSGTALTLGNTAAAARGVRLEEVATHARQGHTGPRASGSIGFAVLRGGDIVGEHTVMLAGQGERVELSHRATDRAIFARGALTTAAWLAARAPGGYGIDDVLGS